MADRTTIDATIVTIGSISTLGQDCRQQRPMQTTLNVPKMIRARRFRLVGVRAAWFGCSLSTAPFLQS